MNLARRAAGLAGLALAAAAVGACGATRTVTVPEPVIVPVPVYLDAPSTTTSTTSTTSATSSDTIPTDTVPPDTVPPDTVPTDTVPPDTAPSDTIPSDTTPSDTTPSDTGPVVVASAHVGVSQNVDDGHGSTAALTLAAVIDPAPLPSSSPPGYRDVAVRLSVTYLGFSSIYDADADSSALGSDGQSYMTDTGTAMVGCSDFAQGNIEPAPGAQVGCVLFRLPVATTLVSYRFDPSAGLGLDNTVAAAWQIP